MVCPHCRVAVHESFSNWSNQTVNEDVFHWQSEWMRCPDCKKIIIRLIKTAPGIPQQWRILVLPRLTSRNPVPSEVEDSFSVDYVEACAVLVDSPKASAALSRRCLQHILREKAVLQIFDQGKQKLVRQKVKSGNLNNEIQQVLDHGGLPQPIAEGLDAVRVIGNFAAHAIKSQSTGEIVDVEPGEAEWNLDVIESLFDYYFVQPAQLAAKRAALNKKLAESGKPPLK